MNTQQRFFAQYFARENGYGLQEIKALHSRAYRALCLPLTLEQLDSADIQNLLKNRAKVCVSLFVYADWLGFTDISIEDVAEFENKSLPGIAQMIMEANHGKH